MKIFSNPDKKIVNIEALKILKESILRILENAPHMTIAISGGSGVRTLLELMSTAKKIPWHLIHIFMVDERCVPITNNESNYYQAKQLLFDKLRKSDLLPQLNLHPFLYNELLEDFGVAIYNQQLLDLGGKLDLLIMGMGEDGHLASLFPNHSSISSDENLFITVTGSPKPPPIRISASKKLLMAANSSLLLSFGEQKREAFENLQDEFLSINECPVKLINSIPNSFIFTDLQI